MLIKSRKVVSRQETRGGSSLRVAQIFVRSPRFLISTTMADYKKYLASSILTEDKVVCIYLKSGVLKV